jgi:uncharacterized protein
MHARIESAIRRSCAATPVQAIMTLVVLAAGNIPYQGLPIFPVGATIALVWVWWSRIPWQDIGYARPRSWLQTIALGVALGVALKLVLKALVMPLVGAASSNQAFGFLIGNEAILPVAIWAMLVAGFAEETVFRGFLFDRLRRVFGRSHAATVGIVVLVSVLFGAVHYSSQGAAGALQAALTGLAFGSIYVVTGRIWIPMLAHATYNLTALALIYWNLEDGVARFVLG